MVSKFFSIGSYLIAVTILRGHCLAEGKRIELHRKSESKIIKW